MTTKFKNSPHPVILAAGAALILFCAVGTAAIMGWLPGSIGRNIDSTDVAVATAPPIKNANSAAEKSHRVNHPARTQDVAYVTNNRALICADCGVIESIDAIETRGQGSGVGVVGGAVVGGLLGNQVGGGRGKDAMTVVGAVGGALAGNQIEKRVRSTTHYDIRVRMDNGSSRVVQEANQPAWHNGDHVKIIDGALRSI